MPQLKLKNGAEILRIDLNLEDTFRRDARGYVLAYFNNEYVTWEIVARAGEEDFVAFWGHYFGHHFGDALEDYNKRRQS